MEMDVQVSEERKVVVVRESEGRMVADVRESEERMGVDKGCWELEPEIEDCDEVEMHHL